MNMHVFMVFVVNCLFQSLGQADIISVSNSSVTWQKARSDCEGKGESLFLLPSMKWTNETTQTLFQLLPPGEVFWTREVASYGPMVALHGCVIVNQSKFVTVQDIGDRNSVGTCLSTCQKELFGLMGSTCYCVNNTIASPLSSDTDNCDKECPGNSNDVCGSQNVTALYTTVHNKNFRSTSNGSCLLYINHHGGEMLFEWADCDSQFDGYICQDKKHNPKIYKDRVSWYGALRKCLEKKDKFMSLPGINAYENLQVGKYWTGIRRSIMSKGLYNERIEPLSSRCLTVSSNAGRLDIKDEDCSALHRYLCLQDTKKASGDTAQDTLWIYVGSGIALVIITCAAVVFVCHRKYCRQKRPRLASFDNLAYNVMTPIHGQRPRSPHEQEPSAVYASIDDLDNTRHPGPTRTGGSDNDGCCKKPSTKMAVSTDNNQNIATHSSPSRAGYTTDSSEYDKLSNVKKEVKHSGGRRNYDHVIKPGPKPGRSNYDTCFVSQKSNDNDTATENEKYNSPESSVFSETNARDRQRISNYDHVRTGKSGSNVFCIVDED